MHVLALTPASSVLLLWMLGDVVVLRNGSEIQGEIIGESKDRLTLRFPGGTMDLARKQILEIRRQGRLEYLLEEGAKQLRRGSSEDAILSFRRAVEEFPESAQARSGLLDALEQQAGRLRDLGRFEEARQAFRSVLETDPQHPGIEEELRIIARSEEEGRREEERGLKEISAGDVEKGIWRLQKVYDTFPDRREALADVLGRAIVERGNQILKTLDGAKAEACYLQALALDPKLLPLLEHPYIVAKHLQVLPLLADGDFAAVEPMVNDGLQLCPTSEVLRYYRGLCLEARGEKREAAEEYLSIAGGKRPSILSRAVHDLRLQAESKLTADGKIVPVPSPRAREVLGGEFRELVTSHFVIQHKNPEVAREVALVAERSYERIFDLLGCVTHLQRPLCIVIHPTRDDYLKASGQEAWSSGSHVVLLKMGTLSDHKINTYQDQPCLASSVIPHEVAHALLIHRLNYPPKLPLWASEGFAILQEASQFHGHYRRRVEREHLRKTLPGPADLLGATDYPEDRVDLFYARAFSLVEFLISLEDLPTFIALLKSASRPGSRMEDEIHRVYGIAGMTALENRWIGWFERKK